MDICAFLSTVKLGIEGNMDLFTGIKILLSWLVPVDRQITSVPYLTWALWFVPVYLCVIIILPMLKQMKESAKRIEVAFLLSGIFVLTCFLKLGWVQNVAFYSFWTYVGLFYSEIKAAVEQKRTGRYFLYSAAVGAVTVFILYLTGQSLDMQSNKFPPNMIFFVFSVMMMALIIFILPYLDRLIGWIESRRIFGKIFNLFSTRSVTVFLYQVFAFNITIRLTNILIHGEGLFFSIVKSVLCLAMTIPVCAGLAVVLGQIEDKVMRK